MKLFEVNLLGNLELKNRVIMPPMCMYEVKNHDGIPTSFHVAHYGARAIGQVGLIIVEATGVSPEGRITDRCLGLWNDSQRDAFKRIVDAVHLQGSKIGIQLNHAGRKSEARDGVDTIYGPSAIAYSDTYRTPEALTQDEIKRIINDFKTAAERADKAGFDLIELHIAHGYLLSSFMSPISNKRTDQYKDAGVLYRELIDAIKTVWPKDKPIIVRVSATDYEEAGYDVEHCIKTLQSIVQDIDAIHVSTGGITTRPPKSTFPGYQVPYATRISEVLKKPVIAVGQILAPEQAMDILENNRADYVAIGRPLLRNPHWYLEAAMSRKRNDLVPEAYQRGFR